MDAEDVAVIEPTAEEIQAALAQAIEAQRTPEERAAQVAEPTPETVADTPEFSEDEHDAFVSAIADAILPPRPYPPVAGRAASAPAAVPHEPMAESVDAPVDERVVETVRAEAAPKVKPKRAKRKQADQNIESATEPVAKDPEPQVKPEPETRPAPAATIEDDELIRQIRVHRDDMVDVDDQIARIDQEIAAQQQAMAHYVAIVEQKNAHRARLVRLRTSTQRFVETLQVKAEPVKRQPKAKKSA